MISKYIYIYKGHLEVIYIPSTDTLDALIRTPYNAIARLECRM